MPFVEDENGNHILDSDGNKINYLVRYEIDNTPAYTHREPLHINDDGHIDNENRIVVIKDGINSHHAVSKAQLDGAKSDINTLIQSSIQTALNKFSVELQKAIIKFRNQQIRNRVGRISLTIPKANYTWIKLLDASEIDGITTLQDVVIQNVYIRRNDNDFSAYYCYFNNHPSDWSMECFLEYIKIPKEINVEDSDEE